MSASSVVKMHSVNRFLGIFLAALAVDAHAGDAMAWFERMRTAVHSEDYEGRFVYQVGPQLRSMYVVHRISGDAELERLVSLNGEHKQVIRGGGAVACLEPGKHRASVLEGMGSMPGAEPSSAEIQRFYDFSLHAEQQVAGRPGRLLKLVPRDDLRFGYEIIVDAQTGLPLHTVMRNPSGQQQSQMLFVDLKTGPDIPPIEHDISALQMTREDRITVAAGVSDPLTSGWRFESLPGGFELRSYRAGERRQHFIFSDGLATLSMYVEELAPQGGFTGASRMGATQAYGDVRHGHQVTAVGEVPDKTLRMMVNTITPR